MRTCNILGERLTLLPKLTPAARIMYDIYSHFYAQKFNSPVSVIKYKNFGTFPKHLTS